MGCASGEGLVAGSVVNFGATHPEVVIGATVVVTGCAKTIC